MARPLAPIVNFGEAAARKRLQGAAARHGAEVFCKVRLADALPVNGSGIPSDLFGYALRAHFDCLVTNERHIPLFAVEYDGSGHRVDARVRENDLRKHALCERFGLPLARVRDEHLFRRARGMDYLTWLSELFFTTKALTEAQDAGQLPRDEPVDPMMVVHAPHIARGTFPLFLSGPARARLLKLHARGLLGAHGPLVLLGQDSLDAWHCMAIVPVLGGVFLHSRAYLYLRNFGVWPFEAVSELAIVDLERQAALHTESHEGGSLSSELREGLVRWLAGLDHVRVQGVVGLDLGFSLQAQGAEVRVGPLGASPAYVHRSNPWR